MRALLLSAIVLLGTLGLAPAATAAAKLMEDPAGDTHLAVFGQPGAPFSTAVTDSADLLWLDVAEDGEALDFTFAVTSLKQPVSFSKYAISFSWKGTEFTAYLYYSLAPVVLEPASTFAYFVNEEHDRWERIAELDHHVDVEQGTIHLRVPKAYIMDEKNRMPLLGDELSDLRVVSESYLSIFQFGAGASDRMPDDGEGAYAIRIGDTYSGHLRLDAEERVRVSNGGSTTFVYQAIVRNTGDVDDEVTLTVADLPEEWNATVQSPVRVPADGERRVTVLASVPFAHDHGGYSSFNLTAKSQRDPNSMASMRMGVLHTPIPQPAGHHNELYLHSENLNGGIFGRIFPWTGATMNTDASHDADAAEASHNAYGGDGPAWEIPLAPGLRMGLDFDVEKTGTLVGSFIGHTTGDGVATAELHLVDDDGESILLLATSDEAPVTLDVSKPSPFTLVLTPTEEADYVPHVARQNLELRISLEEADGSQWGCCIPHATPTLVTADFKLTLPLNEYHDRLTGLAEVAEALDLVADGLVEKAGRPGSVLTYLFTLTNRGAGAEAIELDLAGTDAEHATLVPAGTLELAAGESRRVTLAVTLPAEAADGEEFEVLVFAHAQDDPGKSAIARTKTVATRGADALGDESEVLAAAQEAENETPAPGVALVAGALGAALLIRRGRR